jgi:hypothetical protein
LNNKLTFTKKSSSIFLTAMLIAGTIALSSSSTSSFIVGAEAQTYYDSSEMDNRHNSYGPTPGYTSKYTDSNSYEPTVKGYGNDNIYDNRKSYETNSYEPTTPSYGNDKNYQKTYGNDNNYDKPQFQSYKPDYKSAYPSYGKDDRDKSKDSSSSISINKLNCINNNLNINGNNTGDINVGNSGKSATGPGTDEGYLDVGSLSGNGEEGYGNGYNKQKGESFTCIINNNNINNNFGAGNATDGNVTEPETCEECFRAFLTPVQISAYLQQVNPTSPPTLEQFCIDVGPGGIFDISESAFRTNLASVGVSPEDIELLIACLENVGIEFSS